MKFRTPLALSTTFAVGLVVGGLVAPSVSPIALTEAVSSPSSSVSQAEAGEPSTSRVELTSGDAAENTAPAEAAPRAVLGRAVDTGSLGSSALPRRELAKRALEYTVFVRAGGEYGSGIVVDAKGRVLTSAHVVEGRSRATVTASDQAERAARVVARDEELDLAVLEVDDASGGTPLPWASISTVAMGDDVYAMGAPRKMSFTFSRGIVSHVGRGFDGVRFIQTDVSINSGSSGGPLIDEQGRVIGLFSFVLRDSEGLAFAIPIEYAIRRFPRVFGPLPTLDHFAQWSGRPARSSDKAALSAEKAALQPR